MTVSLIVFISIKLKNNDIYIYIYIKQRVIVSVVKDDDIIYKVNYMLGSYIGKYAEGTLMYNGNRKPLIETRTSWVYKIKSHTVKSVNWCARLNYCVTTANA